MNEPVSALATQAPALAEAFDRSFAEARTAEAPASNDFLAVQIGGDPYAVALADLGELAPLGRITPLPGGGGACLGLTVLRGAVTPVYDLRALLGYPATDADARWFAGLAGARAALAFDAIDGHLRLPDTAFAEAEPDGRLVKDAVRTDVGLRPIIDIQAVLGVVRRLAQRPADTADD